MPNPPSAGRPQRRQYTKEFKHETLCLAAKIGFIKAAADLDLDERMLRRWAKQARLDGSEAFRGNGNRTELESELARLQRENTALRMERDILKKAALYFAKDDP